MAAPIVRRVRVFRLAVAAWEKPVALEQQITAALLPNERIVGVIPGPKMTALMIITETP